MTMTTMWGTDSFEIQKLMKEVNDTKLVLPQFQRLSVWTGANWVPFLMTLVKGRPTGTLLLLESGDDHQEFAPRAIETAPDVSDGTRPQWLLLDGQQRLTTLFRALYSHFEKRSGGPKYEFVIDVKAALERGELIESDFVLVKKSGIGGYAELASQGKLTLRIMFVAADLENWKNAYVNSHLQPAGHDSGHLINELLEVMPGALSIAEYKFPVLKIDRDTPLDVVVDIFEGMNRRGQKLDQFDLMVARLYRPQPDGGRYDLRSAWEDSLEQSQHLLAVGVDQDDGMLPLKLIAKQCSRLDDPRLSKIKGLNNKDVLEVPPEQVIGEAGAPDPHLSLETAVAALDAAAEFLRRVCGVRSPVLLPQKSMLLPLADQFLRANQNRVPEADLKRWFASVGLRGHYYGSVNSYADADCDDLARWADDPDSVPEDVSGITREVVNGLDLRQACTRDGRIVGVTVMSLLVAGAAQDWDSGHLQIWAKPDQVELHHMVPRRRLNSMLPKSLTRDPIAILTPLTAAANSRVSDKQPSEVLQDLGPAAQSILASHRVDRQLLEDGFQSENDFRALLADREVKLREFLADVLGV